MNFENFNFEATGWALGHLSGLGTASEKLVLINLAGRFNDDENYARPGIDRIASDLGIEPRSVKRALKNLAKIGILRVQMRDKLKLPSLYFLNFDFHFEGVGDKKSPKAEKMPVRVTKSRCEGDKKSPTRVTESHPNKQEDNKLLKTQQQPVVVVFEKLIWEKPLTDSEKTACEILLAAANLLPEICQKFADEMVGVGRREPIRNPAGWLKNMLFRYGQPGFSFCYSDQVALARTARTAQAQRESLALPPPPKADPLRRPEREAKILSSVGRASLAEAWAVLQSPAAPPPVGKHQPPVPPGATSAHTVATSTPAADTA